MSTVHIKINETWSVLIIEGGHLEGDRDGISRRALPDRKSYRYTIERSGRQFRSYETAKELLENLPRYIGGMHLDAVRTRLLRATRPQEEETRSMREGEPRGVFLATPKTRKEVFG